MRVQIKNRGRGAERKPEAAAQTDRCRRSAGPNPGRNFRPNPDRLTQAHKQSGHTESRGPAKQYLAYICGLNKAKKCKKSQIFSKPAIFTNPNKRKELLDYEFYTKPTSHLESVEAKPTKATAKANKPFRISITLSQTQSKPTPKPTAEARKSFKVMNSKFPKANGKPTVDLFAGLEARAIFRPLG